jgi:hypothetical protein
MNITWIDPNTFLPVTRTLVREVGMLLQTVHRNDVTLQMHMVLCLKEYVK